MSNYAPPLRIGGNHPLGLWLAAFLQGRNYPTSYVGTQAHNSFWGMNQSFRALGEPPSEWPLEWRFQHLDGALLQHEGQSSPRAVSLDLLDIRSLYRNLLPGVQDESQAWETQFGDIKAFDLELSWQSCEQAQWVSISGLISPLLFPAGLLHYQENSHFRFALSTLTTQTVAYSIVNQDLDHLFVHLEQALKEIYPSHHFQLKADQRPQAQFHCDCYVHIQPTKTGLKISLPPPNLTPSNLYQQGIFWWLIRKISEALDQGQCRPQDLEKRLQDWKQKLGFLEKGKRKSDHFFHLQT